MKREAKLLNFDPAQVAREAMANASAPADKRRPLDRDTGPAADYPIAATGPFREIIEAIHFKTQAPPAIIANAVIAAVAISVSPLYDVHLLNGRTPLTVACLSIAFSGERKTSVDGIALAPVREIEAARVAGHDAKIAVWLADVEARKSAVEHAKKSGKGNRAAIREALEAIGPEPRRPPSPMIELGDITSEGILNHLVDHPLAAIFASEGGTILGGHGMSDDAKLRTGAFLNAAWGGETIRRVRAGSGATLLPGRKMVLHLMAQPTVARILLNDEILNDVGLLARMLIVAPQSTAGTRFYREAPVEADTVLSGYGARMKSLLNRAPCFLDSGNGLDPIVIPLCSKAKQMLVAFHDFVERGLSPDGEFSTIRAFASKMAEHAGRLAGIMAAFENPDLVEIESLHMGNGIKLATHYATEMRRLSESAAVSPELQVAKKLLDWLKKRPNPNCHLAQIYQSGPNSIRDAATAKRIVGILEEHGWVRRLAPGTEVEGSPRRDCWELVA